MAQKPATRKVVLDPGTCITYWLTHIEIEDW